MKDLNGARLELSNLSSDLYHLIKKRKKLVDHIFTLKEENRSFDPEVEIQIFRNPFFKNCSLKEALSLSLLMEDHAAQNGDYPKWSEGAHLNAKPKDLFEMINPILLLSIDLKSFDLLNLSSEFQYLQDYR